ncbi:T-complex protein 11-like protein 1 [Misgurnus anguillicaudatus]|uniref:T-complex protein 11-like protein 1 n=1 Tax=Misgurnus anguillicaudatus TaxID=75329 RepID=UPI00243556AA|nr:T-complex protein 11-like protein 1 [Misgurnus anguillicaudatus]XP_055049102.1 T-complex protein 11-like protein 1 [Misgurnus anguillicaudatus]XP_055049103.1 T-complex protein 11-like protein 1 [Misgurnus anguillicaudatus]XP_055049104.1 T-complex protein 11-like protein 1 [Misgurnus anguillicaudatus]
MSKESNESSKEDLDKDGMENSAQPSEEMIRKRMRRNTPSPHRLTPQSSPPKHVSVEELMETAKGVTNMALAHEIVTNSSFEVKPFEPEEGSLEKWVKDIMHKAFWDCLEAQLNENPPSYSHAIRLVGEIKETLLSCLLPSHSRLRGQIEEVLDLSLIQQEAENGALDISKVAQFIIDMMATFCAPCRDEEVKRLREITDVVPLFKSIFAVLDKMKIDMANFTVSSLRPHLLQQSVEYERKKFQEFLEKQPNALDFTKKWLQSTADYVTSGQVEGGATSTPNSAQLPLTVHNHAYLRLLKWDYDAESFPETVLMDQCRFQEMQLELEQLALVASVLLIVYNSAGEAISGLPGLMDQLKKTIKILVAEMHTPSFKDDEAFATIGEKMCLELRECLSQHGFSPFSTDRESTLKGQIIAAKSADNPIRKVIDSRIQTYLLGFLESSINKSAPVLPGGLGPISKELEEIGVKLRRLVTFNKLVYSPFYQKILQEVLAQGESADV